MMSLIRGLLRKIENNILIRDRGLLFSFISVLSGLIAGAFIFEFSVSGIKNEILSLFLSFDLSLADKTKAELFSGILIEGIIYFIIMLFLGGCIFGKEMTLILTAAKSSGLTAVVGFLYSQYGLKGFEYCLLIFLPGKLVLIFTMLFLTKICYDFSSLLRSGFVNNNEIGKNTGVFILRGLFSLILIIAAKLIDFICILIFSQLFSFEM